MAKQLLMRLFVCIVIVLISLCGLQQIGIFLEESGVKGQLKTAHPPDVLKQEESNGSIELGEMCGNISLATLITIDVDTIQSVKLATKIPREILLSSAYMDKRPTLKTPQVRVFGVTHRDAVHSRKLSCLVWYTGRNNPVIINATVTKMWGYACPHHTVMMSCPVSDQQDAVFVTISDSGCQTRPSNVLQILRSPDNRVSNETDRVAVCTKVLYGQPDPVRLVEWIELMHILGASNIYLYNTSVQGEANSVLRYYEDRDMISVIQHTFLTKLTKRIWGSTFPTHNYNQNWELEILSMNDCMYRAREKYLINLDIDEILHLKSKYHEYMTQTAEKLIPRAASLVFKTGVYSNELGANGNQSIPKYLHIMRHDRRTKIDYESPKSILRRWFCEAAGHHVCLTALPHFPATYHVDASHGHLHHYRKKCRLTGEPHKCEKLLKVPVTDNSLHAYIEELDVRVKPVLQRFKLV